jgi:erythromycin esterase-like protein
MVKSASKIIVDELRQAGSILQGDLHDFDPLMDLVGSSRFVLIGEASHGTHEFYQRRAEITRRLIQEKGFTAVIAEADWPDAYRVNRYIRGVDEDGDAAEALSGFRRFPTWMWRNTVVVDFVGWLREHNDDQRPGRPKAGFYGMDLYSLFTSIEAVLAYLDKTDPDAARRARDRYSCFEHFHEDPQSYGHAAGFDLDRSCEDAVVSQLKEMIHLSAQMARQDGRIVEDEAFTAEQNARLVLHAEEYYREMFRGRVSSWNLRDRHMVQTVEALVAHLDRFNPLAKVVIWAHNSHLGDARATEMGRGGELNVGQLIRQRHGKEAVLIGFSTFDGTVTAADDWDGPALRKTVRPGLPDSYEALFHGAWPDDGLLILRDNDNARDLLTDARLQRAIGVIYRPETERQSHYFYANLPEQFDAIIHLDHTRAVEPLERTAQWTGREVPEAYPTGL